MDPKKKRAEAIARIKAIADEVKAKGRALTDDERNETDGLFKTIDECDVQIKQMDADAEMLAKLDRIADIKSDESEKHRKDEGNPRAGAKSLGEFFVKGLREGELSHLKSTRGFSISTPEYKGPATKAASDTHSTPQLYTDTVLQQVDTTLVRGYRRPLVTDLLGTGSISGTSVKYFIEGALEGSPGMVAAGAQKPQIHLGDPTYRTDEVKKIAAWWDMQDEMIEDIPFWVSEINGRGLQKLSEVEENQLLNGDGTGQNLLGVLNRDGVQVHAGKADDIADELYKAMSKVQLATGLVADGLIINPVDYQALRLNKDGNGQYFGGGYFSGQYGNGGIVWQPPVWGLNTVVSVAAAAGSPVLGAFKQATTVYRKGGVRVESTNSDQGKFTSDIYTTRIEERLALAVRVPSAIVKINLT